jgi:hypothetical protein
LENGSQICLFRKEGDWGDWIEYPNIDDRVLGNMTEGKEITYLKDDTKKIYGYNLAYNINIDNEKYFSLNKIQKKDTIERVLDVLTVILFTILSLSMIAITVFFYVIAETEDMYLY